MKKKLLRERELQELEQRLEVAVEKYKVGKEALEKAKELQPKKRGKEKND